MKKPSLSATAVLVGALALVLSGAAPAQTTKWEALGRKDDYVMSWASNIKIRKDDTVATLMRMKFDREDAAPNNARFDSMQIGIDIRCPQRTYKGLGQSYHMGNREVYRESFASAGSEYAPVEGTMIAKFVDKACAE